MFYKRIAACIMTVAMVASMAACGNSVDTSSASVEPTTAASIESAGQAQTTTSATSSI